MSNLWSGVSLHGRRTEIESTTLRRGRRGVGARCVSSPDVFGAFGLVQREGALPALPRRRPQTARGFALQCATRQPAKPWSRLRRVSDWMAAVRGSGQRSRAGGDATGILRLCVSESDPRRDGDCFLYSGFGRRHRIPAQKEQCGKVAPPRPMVPCLRRLEWKSKRRIPYIGWNETVRNCCFRSSACPCCASAKVPPKSQMPCEPATWPASNQESIPPKTAIICLGPRGTPGANAGC